MNDNWLKEHWNDCHSPNIRRSPTNSLPLNRMNLASSRFICSADKILLGSPLPLKKAARYEINRPITMVYLIWGGINMMTVQASAVEAFSTTKMAATVYNAVFGFRYRGSIKTTRQCIYFIAQCCITLFVAMIGCRPIQLRSWGSLVCAWWWRPLAIEKLPARFQTNCSLQFVWWCQAYKQ
jgi:hypothetical protein